MTRRNLTDLVATSFQSLTPFFRDGWGDEAVIDEIAQHFFDLAEPSRIDVRWAHEESKRGIVIREGYFETPSAFPMPPQARTAWFEMLLPPHSREVRPPVVVHLAATGDQGYRHRRRLAKKLVYRGIGSVILENPYYGKRTPRGQVGVAVRTVADQLMMNYATVLEAHALMNWLTERGHPATGVTGYSMGGFMSAYAAALYRAPIVAVPCAAGVSPGFTFVHTHMQKVPDWDALRQSVDNPRERFEELLDVLSVDRLSPPVDTESAFVLAAERDAIVPPEQSVLLHRHWQGSRLRWLNAGHITGFLVRLGPIVDAVYDAFAVRLYKDGAERGGQ
jgi:pimeloyl-ACP methyl ester carboxylesterase